MKTTPLKIGDTLGIIALSSPITSGDLESQFKKGVEEIHKMGFKTKLGKTINLTYFHFAGNDEQRAKDLMEMYDMTEGYPR